MRGLPVVELAAVLERASRAEPVMPQVPNTALA